VYIWGSWPGQPIDDGIYVVHGDGHWIRITVPSR
jgi:hypothetical protein